MTTFINFTLHIQLFQPHTFYQKFYNHIKTLQPHKNHNCPNDKRWAGEKKVVDSWKPQTIGHKLLRKIIMTFYVVLKFTACYY